ncbi:MAG: hypothetical protein K6G76_11865 [Lachnospiraceae bacterium]|nr:hypothetical protein [Lachnospiraceae bacterium]
MDNKMSFGQWLLTIFLICIPCVNLVLLIVWAVGDGGGYTARKTFSLAYLIVSIAISVLSFIFGIVVGMFGAAAASSTMLFFL